MASEDLTKFVKKLLGVNASKSSPDAQPFKARLPKSKAKINRKEADTSSKTNLKTKASIEEPKVHDEPNKEDKVTHWAAGNDPGAVLNFGPEPSGEDTLLAQEWGCDPGLSLTVRGLDESELLNKDKRLKVQPAVIEQVSFNKEPVIESDLDSLKNQSEAALKVLAGNPRTETNTLCWLASHVNPEIRATVARNSHALLETVWLLAKDYDEAVRLAIAEHLESNRDLLRALTIDPSPLVAWRAQYTLSLVSGGKDKDTASTSEVFVGVDGIEEDEITSENPFRSLSLPKQDLPERGQSQEEVEFLQIVAQKPTTPARRLAELARHPNPKVRQAVAENANSPLESLWLLSKDPLADVKVKLADNYNCPLEIIESLKDDGDQFEAWRARSLLAKLSGESYPDVSLEEGPSATSSPLAHSH